jgi:PAS domain S-box-containing protein
MLFADADVHTMDLSILLEEALAERGNAMMLIAQPRAGERALIEMANAPFARIVGLQANVVAGLRLAELRPLVERTEDWATLIAALRSLSALMLDLRLRVNGREVWLGFNLTFKTDPAGGDDYGILIGRDITEVREHNLRESESQRLLASVFLRIGAAVAIIDGDSAILMANPACQQLLGYGPGEMTGKHVDHMIAPESSEAVRAARARQLGGAGDYVLPMAVLAKGGSRVSVTLHSTLLCDARERKLRVATLIPDNVLRNALPAEIMPEETGQLRAVSLAALKAAYGKEWPLIADRAMRLAEHILKRHLGVADVLRCHNDDSFLIWFDSSNAARNAAVLAAATQEIRQRLLENANDVLPDWIGYASIGAEAMPVAPLALPAIARAGMHLDFQDGSGSPLEHDPPGRDPPGRDPPGRDPPGRDPEALMQYLRAGAVADVEIVTGRDGVERPIVLVDFESPVRGCLYHLAPSLCFEPCVGNGFDLMRLNLAVQALAGQSAETKVLAPFSWTAMADPDCRPVLDRRLAEIGQTSRSRIMLAVSGVPRLLSKQRWSDVVAGLRRQLGDVALLLTHRAGELAAMQDAVTSEWPLSMLVVDRSEGPPVLIDEYRGLFAAAGRREVAVLVRTTARNDILDWRKLGATMFAAAA